MTDLFRLRAREIRKSFGGVEVLRGVDLDATGGDVLALLGENGAGKSTLVKILAGDYEADSGTIEIAGESHRTLDPAAARRRGIRMIFQELAAAPDLSVAENVMLGQWPSRRGIVNWRAVQRLGSADPRRDGRRARSRRHRSRVCGSPSGRSSRSRARSSARRAA